VTSEPGQREPWRRRAGAGARSDAATRLLLRHV